MIKTNATESHGRRALGEYAEYSTESGRTCIEIIFGVLVNRFAYLKAALRDDYDRIK